MRKHVNDLFADAQKFAKTLRSVRACEPTGGTEDQVLSMAVAVHMGKCEIMSYEEKNFGPLNWIGCMSWFIWRNYLKWMSPTAQATEDGGGALVGSGACNSTLDGGGTSIRIALASGAVEDDAGNLRSVLALPAGLKPELRFGIGTKYAKLVRQVVLWTQAVCLMADSTKIKSDTLEKRNAIAAFSRPEAAELPETSQFFSLLRNAHLA